jgi:hypothetical protein
MKSNLFPTSCTEREVTVLAADLADLLRRQHHIPEPNSSAPAVIRRLWQAVGGTCECDFDPSFTGGFCDTCGRPEEPCSWCDRLGYRCNRHSQASRFNNRGEQ